MHVQARIGTQLVPLCRPLLRARDCAWLLESSETEVRNAMRRGERLLADGLSEEEVLERGALPVRVVAGRRCVGALTLAGHPEIRERPLALQALAGLVEGRLRAPRSDSPEQPPRPLLHDLAAISGATARTWR